MFFQNRLLRELLMQTYRAYARCVFFLPGPRVFINSIPKAGVHLLTSLLIESPKLMLAGRHIQHWQVNRLAGGPGDNLMTAFDLDAEALQRLIATVHPGQILTAHLRWDERIPDLLAGQGYATLFLIRDPRDILVSQLYYIKGLTRHPLHEWFTKDFSSDDRRLIALIRGRTDPLAPLPSISERLSSYAGWCQASSCRLTRFEDLVGACEAEEEPLREYARILSYVGRPSDVERLRPSEKRRRAASGYTFRRGKAGDWRSHFDAHHKDAFKELAGEALIAFGYERNLDW